MLYSIVFPFLYEHLTVHGWASYRSRMSILPFTDEHLTVHGWASYHSRMGILPFTDGHYSIVHRSVNEESPPGDCSFNAQ